MFSSSNHTPAHTHTNFLSITLSFPVDNICVNAFDGQRALWSKMLSAIHLWVAFQLILCLVWRRLLPSSHYISTIPDAIAIYIGAIQNRTLKFSNEWESWATTTTNTIRKILNRDRAKQIKNWEWKIVRNRRMNGKREENTNSQRKFNWITSAFQ